MTNSVGESCNVGHSIIHFKAIYSHAVSEQKIRFFGQQGNDFDKIKLEEKKSAKNRRFFAKKSDIFPKFRFFPWLNKI